MALRLQLAPQAVHTLSRCPAPVRERVQCELGALVAAQPVGRRGSAAETVVLHSGFHVRYQLDAHHGLLNLLDLWAPKDAPRSLPV
jgi:hypothetical protein